MAIDLHLQVTSPCKDTGVSVGLARDYDNNTVPYAGVPDMGAYEYQGGSGDGQINITDGVNTIVNGTNFSFGSKTTNTNTDQEFTIQNLAEFNLTLSGSPIVVITGANSDQFSVISQPTTPIASGQHVHFTLRFTPTSAGAKTAQISIASNDTDNTPYVITLTGTGVDPITTYYVNNLAAAGGDGTTTDLAGAHCAFNTIAAVQAAVTGDKHGVSVLFAKGTPAPVYREMFTNAAYGTAAGQFTIGTYGTGLAPIINGSDIITGWAAADPDALLEWTSKTDTHNHLSVSLTQYQGGFRGLDDHVTDTTVGYLEKVITYTGTCWITYYIKLNPADVASSKYYKPHSLTQDTGEVEFILLKKTGTYIQVYSLCQSGGGTLNYTDAWNDNNWHKIDVKCKWDTGGTGYHKVYVDDVPLIETINITNTLNRQINQIRIAGQQIQDGIGDFHAYYDTISVSNGTTTVFTSTFDLDPPANTWKVALATESKQAWMDDVKLTKGTSTAALNDHEWFWYSNVLYFRDATGNPDSAPTRVIEAGQRLRCITSTDIDYITIDGLSLKRANSTGLLNTRGDYWIARNNTVTDCLTYGILYLGHATSDLPVVGGQIYGNTMSTTSVSNSVMLMAQGTTDVIIRNNTITGVSSGSALGTSDGDNVGGGATSSGSQVYFNDISGAYAGIFIKYTTGAYVYRNYIHDGSGYGIAINSYSNGAYVYYNKIYNLTAQAAAWNGLDINVGSTNGFAYNNTIYKVAGFCLTLEAATAACDGWTIKNNILDSSANYVKNLRSESVYLQTPAMSVYAFDTNLFNTSTGIAFTLADGLITDLATWNARDGVATDILGDPLFVSTVTPDFHLQLTSPALNVGTNVGLTLDYDGNTVPFGATGVDIGAYEYQGLGGAPEIDITDGTTSIPVGLTFAFGTKTLASNTDQIFTIANSGSGNLILSGSPIITITGTNADQFSVQAQPTSPVPASDHVHFTLRFTPTTVGAKVAAISIANDDADENPYVINLTGSGAGVVEINIKQGTTNIASGGTFDLGSVLIGSSNSLIFTIENLGSIDLTLSGSPIVTLGGTNPTQFAVTAQPTTPIAASGSTTFTIRFTPTSQGAKSATVAIVNNDTDENPYNITFTGTGTANPLPGPGEFTLSLNMGLS